MGQDLKGNPQNKTGDHTDCPEGAQMASQAMDGRSEESGKGVSRRDVAKAGAAAPLLMSLFSRPAWGGGVCSVSSLASGNASGRHDDDECNGNGCTPGFWKNNLVAWLGTGYSPGTQVINEDGKATKEWTTEGATTFASVFGFPPVIGDNLTTLLDVMLEHELAGSTGTYENHLVAALLNAAKAPAIFGSTVTQIIEVAYAVRMGTPYQGRIITESEFHQLLANMNESGQCFLNAHGECAPGYVSHEGMCIPSCKQGERFDLNSNACVLLTNWDPDIHQGIED